MARKTARPGRTLGVFFLGLAIAFGLVALGGTWKPELGLDLQGGTSIRLTPKGNPSAESLDEARKIIDQRVNGSGVAEAEVTVQGNKYIVVEIPGDSRRDLVDTVKRQAQLRFRIVACSDFNPGPCAGAPTANPQDPTAPEAEHDDVVATIWQACVFDDLPDATQREHGRRTVVVDVEARREARHRQQQLPLQHVAHELSVARLEDVQRQVLPREQDDVGQREKPDLGEIVCAEPRTIDGHATYYTRSHTADARAFLEGVPSIRRPWPIGRLGVGRCLGMAVRLPSRYGWSGRGGVGVRPAGKRAYAPRWTLESNEGRT